MRHSLTRVLTLAALIPLAMSCAMNKAEKGAIIFPAGSFFQVRPDVLGGLPHFMIEDRRIQCLFGWEMTKDNGLADARMRGDLFGRGAIESFPREERGSHRDDLLPPIAQRLGPCAVHTLRDESPHAGAAIAG